MVLRTTLVLAHKRSYGPPFKPRVGFGARRVADSQGASTLPKGRTSVRSTGLVLAHKCASTGILATEC